MEWEVLDTLVFEEGAALFGGGEHVRSRLHLVVNKFK